jgi:hypothetical protein
MPRPIARPSSAGRSKRHFTRRRRMRSAPERACAHRRTCADVRKRPARPATGRPRTWPAGDPPRHHPRGRAQRHGRRVRTSSSNSAARRRSVSARQRRSWEAEDRSPAGEPPQRPAPFSRGSAGAMILAGGSGGGSTRVEVRLCMASLLSCARNGTARSGRVPGPGREARRSGCGGSDPGRPGEGGRRASAVPRLSRDPSKPLRVRGLVTPLAWSSSSWFFGLGVRRNVLAAAALGVLAGALGAMLLGISRRLRVWGGRDLLRTRAAALERRGRGRRAAIPVVPSATLPLPPAAPVFSPSRRVIRPPAAKVRRRLPVMAHQATHLLSLQFETLVRAR